FQSLPNVKDQTAKQDPVSVTDSDDKDKNNKNKEKEKAEKEKPKKDTEQQDKQSTDNENKNATEKPTKNNNDSNQTDDEYIVGENAAPKDEPKIKKQKMDLEQKEETTNDVSTEDIQKTVYTVTTDEMQGSGFIYDWNSSVITNAHVVEGWTKATVQTSDGQSYKGQVIGYSNKTDVAVISVPELKGKKPATINSGKSFPIGEEIIALGSPNGTSKTTYGYITGKNRSFVIGSFVYDNLYQISNLIKSWINSPMSNDDLLAEFYGDDGDPMIGEEWDEEEGYFEEGDISEDDDHYNYWEDEEKDSDKEDHDKVNEDKDENKDQDKDEEKDKDKDKENSSDKEKQEGDDPDKEEVEDSTNDSEDKATDQEKS